MGTSVKKKEHTPHCIFCFSDKIINLGESNFYENNKSFSKLNDFEQNFSVKYTVLSLIVGTWRIFIKTVKKCFKARRNIFLPKDLKHVVISVS